MKTRGYIEFPCLFCSHTRTCKPLEQYSVQISAGNSCERAYWFFNGIPHECRE